MDIQAQTRAMATIMYQHLLHDQTQLVPEDDVQRAADLIRDYVLFLRLPDQAIALALAFHPSVERWSAWPVWAPALAIARQAAEHHGTQREQIQLLNCCSQALRELGDRAQARHLAVDALQRAEALRDPPLIAAAQNKLGLIAFHADELDDARQYLAQAYEHGQAGLPALELGHICLNRGLVAVEQGQGAEARAAFQQAIQHYQDADDSIHIAKVYCDMVALDRREGRLRRIPQILRTARDTFRRAGAYYEYGLAENDIGYLYLELRQFLRAEKAFQQALHIFEQLHALSAHALVLSNIAELYVTAKRWDRAAVALEQARHAAIRCARPLLLAAVDVDEGRMRAARGDLREARALWQAALAVQQARGATFAAQQTQRFLDSLPPE